VVAIAGNKADQQEGKFNNSKVLEYCAAKGIEHSEVSAKSGDNVEAVFRNLAEKLTQVHPKAEKKETPQSQVVSKVMQKKNEFKLKSGAV
jgi:50S ribosomal subunit-associated GTPase HflX